MQSAMLRPQGNVSGTKRPLGYRSSSTNTEGFTGSPRQKYRKGDRSRRMWTTREEEILASTMLELVARGWKSDNGFRSGYLGKIEDSLRTEFPDCDLKGTPHITSKISAWKKSYSSLKAILSRTGVGFNTYGTYKIDCDDEQWEQIVAVDKDAKFMRTKSWPFWETWKSIFGKDRAGGAGAEEMDVAAVRARAQVGGGSQVNDNYYRPSFDDFPVDQCQPLGESQALGDDPEIQDNTSGNSGKQASTNKHSSSKGNKQGQDSALMDFLSNLHAETNSRLEMIAARIGYDFDLGKARQEVFDKLGEVDGLTLKQRYQLCNILSDKPQRLEVFTGMPTNARLGYVLMLIEDNQ